MAQTLGEGNTKGIAKLKDKLVKAFLTRNRMDFSRNEESTPSNVFGFLDCDYYVKSGSYIHYLKRRECDYKKIIILSATPNIRIYEKLYGNRLKVHDVGRVETKGIVIHYPESSFSAFAIKKEPKLLEVAGSMARRNPVITHLKFKSHFPTAEEAHFGYLSGIDKYRGKDLFVVGTPHKNPSVYYLYARVLGIDYDIKDTKMNFQEVEYDGFVFYFNTFKNNYRLQQLQMSMIQAELLQAVGRARVLREDCTVTMLGRMPIQGAETRYFDADILSKFKN